MAGPNKHGESEGKQAAVQFLSGLVRGDWSNEDAPESAPGIKERLKAAELLVKGYDDAVAETVTPDYTVEIKIVGGSEAEAEQLQLWPPQQTEKED